MTEIQDAILDVVENVCMNSWAKSAAIRAGKTMAQVELASLLVKKKGNLNVAIVAGLLSVIMSMKGLPEVQLEKTLYDLDNEVIDDGEEE